MPRTPEQLEQAARDTERWLNELDPATTPAEDTADLRAIGLAVIDKAAAETRIAETVATAREHGRSWGQIAMVLGVSRQSARERFGKLVDH